MEFIRSLADNTHYHSLANRWRRKRFRLFQELLNQLPRPLTILDVGGTQEFWMMMDFALDEQISITLANIVALKVSHSSFHSVTADARDLQIFKDNEFDVVFSNSVIEHVGKSQAQLEMAQEIKRVGKRYFVQTPNKYFPLEPHFLFPFFQFLPLTIRAKLLTKYRLGWTKRLDNLAIAREVAESVNLLSRRELAKHFPEGQIACERFCFLTKSFVVYQGWEIA